MTVTDDMMITLDRAKLHAGLASRPDTSLSLGISVASVLFQKHCNRLFFSQAYTATMDGDGSQTLILPQYPVTALTSVTLIASDGTETPYDNTYFRFKTNGIVRWAPATAYMFPYGFQNVQVQYTAGFATLPAPVEEAMCNMIVFLLDMQTVDTHLQSERLGEYAATYMTKSSGESDGWPDIVTTLLAKYRLRVVVGGLRGR